MPDQTKSAKNNQVCDCDTVHEDVVALVRSRLPDDAHSQDLADFFKVFSDPTRVRIVLALDEHELCVCDLAVLLNLTKSAISHQLAYLRQRKLVRNRRDGKTVYYSLADKHIQDIIEIAVEHTNE
ncbi:helix-turn-helix transcriptional regulator [Oscillospiraceae bacterium HV4-5-C5C]|nr:metalloregulator ArsR/SmtB family transcription factor [Oscillospiraceae bacterium]MDD4367406.1 metalloregulator ArsR/SmtB family transcription factor [Oscillospiraceae bacterium]NJP41359.1 helix-turn-helix transcriptional regulator [Oscillospiraceae bacterium HV4-5-C5C]